MARTAKSSDRRSHAPIITLHTKTTNNSSPTNVGAKINNCLSLLNINGRYLMTLMNVKSLGITNTNEDLSHDWIAICEVSDNEGFEYPSEDDEDDNDDNDDYNGDDGHYDDDNPNILEATSSSLLEKYLLRKLKTANMAVTALIHTRPSIGLPLPCRSASSLPLLFPTDRPIPANPLQDCFLRGDLSSTMLPRTSGRRMRRLRRQAA